jgi:hypothetical protein
MKQVEISGPKKRGYLKDKVNEYENKQQKH